MTIRAFIANGQTYTFPLSPADQSWDTNFGDSSPKMTKLVGADGGFDEYGMSRAASEIGTVTFDIVLVSATRAGMQALRDSLKTMTAWGKGRLIDTINGVDRWCWARISAADIKELRHQNTDIFQPVKLTFSVSDPYWYTTGLTSKLWGSGLTWGGGTKWGGASSFNFGNVTFTNNGSADTLVKITINNASGSTAYTPILRRIVNGAIMDELTYNGAIADGEQISINPYTYTCSSAGVNKIANLAFKHPVWMRAVPGSNTITITATGNLSFQIQYYERFV